MKGTIFDRMRNVIIGFLFEENFVLVFVTSDLFLLWCSKHTVFHQEGSQLPSGVGLQTGHNLK